MLSVLLLVVYVYLLFIATWALYIVSMQFKHHKDRLYPVAKANAYLIVAAMLVLDFVVNIVASIPLLELPRWDKGEFLLSPRLERHKQGDTWRYFVAAWICEHFLNQFDRSGDHC